MVRGRAARLARSFRIVALAAGAADLYACDQAAREVFLGGDGGADSGFVGDDIADPSDGSRRDSTADTSDLGIDAACAATVTAIDAGADVEELCNYYLPCGIAQVGLGTYGCEVFPLDSDGSILDAAPGFPVCILDDNRGCFDGGYSPTAAGVSFSCIGCPGGGGRRPAGFVRRANARGVGGARAVGECFADLFALEVASVAAFRRMGRELESHGAPRALVSASRSSAGDEVRHARMMAKLATRFGARPAMPRVRNVGRRSLAAIARENAVEGCLKETFGALVNAWQASHANDEDVRASMQQIAADELRHAALSWEIAEWASSKLRVGERRSIARAQKKAASQLIARAAVDSGKALRETMGLPLPAVCVQLARGMVAELGVV